MDLRTIKLLREEYRNLLNNDSSYNDVLFSLIRKNEYEPLLFTRDINPESDLSYNEEQRQLSEILLDMHSVNNSIIEAKDRITELITNLDDSLETIRNSVRQQIEQAEDINIICGLDSAYSSVIPIYAEDFGDTSAEVLDSKTIGAEVTSTEIVPYDIIAISGNGYSGNAFVYNNGVFEIDENDKSNLQYISDINDVTIYEYSRLCADNKKAVINDLINYDNKPVECTITLGAKKAFSQMKLNSANEHLLITRLEISEDGIQYNDYLQYPLEINNLEKIYNDSTYVYGSNMLCFPYTNYVRITLSNADTTDDTIAMVINNKIKKINARRKCISIAGIELYASTYNDADLLSTEILEGGSIDKISLFASEYIPDHFVEQDYIHYYLILNGQEYEVVPANSKRDGTTIIKYSEESSSLSDSIVLIHETIKSVKLKITIAPHNLNETPYISNLKLCIGKNTGNIYV